MPHSAPDAPYVYKIDIVNCEKFIKSNFIHILMENNSFHKYIWAAYFLYFWGGGERGGTNHCVFRLCFAQSISNHNMPEIQI